MSTLLDPDRTITFDMTPLIDGIKLVNSQMLSFQEKYLTELMSYRTTSQQQAMYGKKSISWESPAVPKDGISGYTFTMDDKVTFEFAGTWSGTMAIEEAPQPKPRAVTRQEILASLEKIVSEVGTDYVATSNGTNNTGFNGRRCVQGELMVDLGFATEGVWLPGSYDGVTSLFCLDEDGVAYSVLEEAETMNDAGEPWSDILAMAKTAFGKAA